MRKSLLFLALYFVTSATVLFGQTADTIVRLSTSLGNIDVQLDSTDAPNTVANFLGYADNGYYDSSFIHRSVPGFIIQGGGYDFVDDNVGTIPAGNPVNNEYKRSNLRGTIALAKVGSDPNSGTNQWFFNLADNSANLNTQNGGFTVFGGIVNDEGLAVMDAIAALHIVDFGSPFDTLPVINYTSGSTLTASNLVIINSITHLASHPGFFNGETGLSNAVYYLSFPATGNYFGYYSYLSDVHYIYHFDLGYEYVFDANDGHKGAYFYDFKSGGFFYSSPTFPFPYLYDFSLNSVVYYYPDPNNAGHYNTNGTRFFYVFNTGKIISK